MKHRHCNITTRSNYTVYVCCVVGILFFFSLSIFHEGEAAGRGRSATQKKSAHKRPAIQHVTIGTATKVQIPFNYRLSKPMKRVYRSHDFMVKVFSKRFAQGNAGYMEIVSLNKEGFPSDFGITADLEGKQILLTRMLWGYRGIFAFPVDMRPGQKTITVKTTTPVEEITYTYPITVRWTRFPVYRGSMDLGKYSNRNYLKGKPELLKKIQDNYKKRAEVFSRVSSDLLTAHLAHPRNYHKITSAFNAKRITRRYIIRGRRKISKKSSVHQHSGVDLKGWDGTPVYALASGKVAVAEDMYYEGNHTMIDHGNGIITRYMHQSKIIVTPGQFVKGGQLIGYCGKTGMVTGPHLHIGLYIRGEYVDPLSFLSLPIRE
ncbi:MAG TPA: M23 family metallopeptidase [Spirochaetota bacterium]|nr:M23 family metallopeptidase [Spirochaetota bacterium]